MLNDLSIKESAAFLVTNASGRHINLLNDNEQQLQPTLFTAPSPSSSKVSDEISSPFRIYPPVNTTPTITEEPPTSSSSTTNSGKRKYHCLELGCNKSFTTSGHLSRHNRTHSGERNFPCLFPGCQSRFSRQDNMMQHYRTHMSPKSRRTQHKKMISEDLQPKPKLHAHQRIQSDPYRVEKPLTIDQHLNNYRRSLQSHPSASVKYNMPPPLGSVAQSHMQKQQQQQKTPLVTAWSVQPVAQYLHQEEEAEMEQYSGGVRTPQQPHEVYSSPAPIQPTIAASTGSESLFYQHRPLTYSTNLIKSNLPFTLLHPTRVPRPIPTTQQCYSAFTAAELLGQDTPPLLSSSSSSSVPTTISKVDGTTTSQPTTSSSEAGLLQLAHIVSTFG